MQLDRVVRFFSNFSEIVAAFDCQIVETGPKWPNG